MTALIQHVFAHTLPAAFSLLPPEMTSDRARAMLLAIGLQESRFEHRRQVGPGPARGFWQFERQGGVFGVLTHPGTQPIIEPICAVLRYRTTSSICHLALEHNDVLAACFARLLLWTDPDRLPSQTETQKGWDQYLRNWRPGKPHPETWPAYYREAWQIVNTPTSDIETGADILGGGAT